jgi:hypothetical protein
LTAETRLARLSLLTSESEDRPRKLRIVEIAVEVLAISSRKNTNERQAAEGVPSVGNIHQMTYAQRTLDGNE